MRKRINLPKIVACATLVLVFSITSVGVERAMDEWINKDDTEVVEIVDADRVIFIPDDTNTITPILSPSPVPSNTPTPTPSPTSTPIPSPSPTPNPREKGDKIYDVAMPAEHQWYLYDKCIEQGVDFELAIATIWRESGFNQLNHSSNKNGTIDAGYFQINECNWEYYREMFGDDWDPYNPFNSIDAGVVHIKKASTYDDDPLVFMMVYNMGATGAKRCWNDGKYSSSYSRSLVKWMIEELPSLLLCEDYESY